MIGSSPKTEPTRKLNIIDKIGSNKITNLEDFVTFMKSAKDGDTMYLLKHDYVTSSLAGVFTPSSFTLRVAANPLTVRNHSQTTVIEDDIVDILWCDY